MEDKERFKEHIRSLVRKLQQTMLAQRFELKIQWDVVLPEGTVARVLIDEPYWLCTIQIGTSMYETEWRNKNYHDIGKYLVHEFCHTIIDPLYNDWIKPYENAANKDVITNAVERQTQLMCFIVMGLIPDEEWIPAESDSEGTDGGEQECVRVRDAEENREEERAIEPTTRLGISLNQVATSKE